MNAINNVAALNQGSVFEDIQTFIRSKEKKSESTAINYERSIRQFFTYMRKGKMLEQLVEADLKFKNSDALRYQLYLSERYENSTVNAYMFAIQSLYNFLEKNEYPVKAKVMEVDALSTSESESYGKLGLQEAEKMAELVKKQVKGIEKSALIKLAYKTSIREGALLSLEWSDIKKVEDKDMYVIETIDKGNKKDRKPISEQMYNELLQIKQQEYYKRYNDNKVFHITTKTVWQMMNTLRAEMNIPDDRNVVFHSFKNVAINWELQVNNDVQRAKIQGNHSDVNTTLKHYADNNSDLESMAGIQMEKQIDDSVFDHLTLEQFKQLCKGIENGLGMQLRIRAQKIINAGV